MTVYTEIATGLVIGLALGALMVASLIKKSHKSRPLSPATKIRRYTVTVTEVLE